MSDYLFLFDLDSTLTRQEVVPTVSGLVSAEASAEMRRITEETMIGKIPFRQSLIDRVKLLSHVDVELVNQTLSTMPLNEKLVDFARRNRDRCYIVTGNLDVWIRDLVKRMGLEGHVFCSKTLVKNGQIQQLVTTVDKRAIAQMIVGPFVAIGDGSNDIGMAELAEISVGYGGVRPVAPGLAAIVDRTFDEEDELVSYLESLL